MQGDISKLSENVDVVIVSYHWGVSSTLEPVSYQSVVGRAAIDAGADLVFGHGPHKYQKIEIHKDRLIFHSLGQFVFDDHLRLGDHREGLLARIVVRDGELAAASLVPSWLDDNNDVRLENPQSGKGRELFGYLSAVNGADGAKLIIRGNEIVVTGEL